MAKRKNKKNKTVESERILNTEVSPTAQIESKLEIGLNTRLSELKKEIETLTQRKESAFQYLSEDHQIYQTIKNNACCIQKKAYDGQAEQHPTISGVKTDAVFFDFENNCFSDENGIREMPTCYLSGSDLHVCKGNGIYTDTKQFSAAKLFLAEKKTIDGDSSYISSFEKAVGCTIDSYDLNGKFPSFCMLPEAIDLFNTRIRRCLNTNKGKIISIPKSIAITYYHLNELNFGDRYCVIDMDGLHPVITQLSIGKDEHGKNVILREGFVSEKEKILYTYRDFALKYLSGYEQKYKVRFSENEKDNLINNKQIIKVLSQKGNYDIFRDNGKIVLEYDENIFIDCLSILSSSGNIFKNYRTVYISSAIEDIVLGDNIKYVPNELVFAGLSIIRGILLDDPEAVIWKERLPKVSLEVIDESIGRFKTINLIEENNEGQSIRLAADEEIELPFRGTITLQKGKKDYYLPLEREIYSEDVNSAKEAYFFDKSFPLANDVPVELVVKYNYMSDSPIKIYARPKIHIQEFTELPNIWVDRHEIEQYSGPVYEGHPKEIKTPYVQVFDRTKKVLERFICGRTCLFDDRFSPDKTGIRIHQDLTAISSAYFFIRSTFDSYNVQSESFIDYWFKADVGDFWASAHKAVNVDSKLYKGTVKNFISYRNGLEHILAECVVASWYYDQEDDDICAVFEYLVELNKTKILAKLSRCIMSNDDDVYDVFERLAEKLYDDFSEQKPAKKFQERIIYIRTLSQNCWFSKDWLSMLYNTEFGPQAIQLMVNFISEYLKREQFGNSKIYRDIMEFLVCLTMVKNQESDMFNPNDESTRELLDSVKKSFEIARTTIEPEKLKSRLEMKQDQGSLYGYPNYIYMLVMTLSGEGQVNLVGYRDE